MKSILILIVLFNLLQAFDDGEIKALESELDSKIKSSSSKIKQVPVNTQTIDDVYENYNLIVKNYKELKSRSKELKDIYERSEKVRSVYDKYIIVVKNYMNGAKSYTKQKAFCNDMKKKFGSQNPSDYSIVKLQNQILKKCHLSADKVIIDFKKMNKEFSSFESRISRLKEFALIDQTTATSLIKQLLAMENMINKSLKELNVDNYDTNFELIGEEKISTLASKIDKNYSSIKENNQALSGIKILINDMANKQDCYLDYFKSNKNSSKKCDNIRIDLLNKYGN